MEVRGILEWGWWRNWERAGGKISEEIIILFDNSIRSENA